MQNFDVAVAQYTNNPVTSAIPEHPFALLAVNLAASTTYARGVQLGELTATPGTFAPYNVGGADGSQTARAILPFPCSTDASGNITVGTNADPAGFTVLSVPAIFAGYVRCEDVSGLTTASAAVIGKLIKGTVSAGILKIA